MDQEVLLLLAELLKKPLKSIEILPGGLKEWESQTSNCFPFILVDGHLGVPQKVLHKLYLAAMALYKNSTGDTLSTLSSVILLANPAHQTALNARKKFLRSGQLKLQEELNLSALFIGSSKECAKQSIIWDHRRWIFRHYYERVGDVRSEWAAGSPGWGSSEEASFYPKMPPGALGKECELIRRACELYPRNYHAWVHYHWVLDLAKSVITGGQEMSVGLDLQEHVRFLRQEVTHLREWIDRHVSDYSAVHLLSNITVIERAGALQLARDCKYTLVEELREHALSLVVSYPSHETLWLYLRNFLSFSTPEVIYSTTDRLRSCDQIPLNAVEKYIMNLL